MPKHPPFFHQPRSLHIALTASLLALLPGCSSVKKAAVGQLADALSSGGSAFATDEDPELVKQAVPFSLKLMESLLAERPDHEGLLLSCTKGFTQYSYAFVLQEADELESKDYAESEVQRARARHLFLRARDYGLRALALHQEHFAEKLAADPLGAVAKLKREQVSLLYWTASAWGSAIACGKDQPSLVAELPQVEALIDRALALDEAWGEGAIHSFLITYEMSRQGLSGDPALRAQKHFDRAIALSRGKLVGPYVAFAEAVCVEKRDAVRFEALLKQALTINPDDIPEHRLENKVMQQRAQWLLSRKGDLFLGSTKAP